jgi:hypothetical protein
MEISKFTRGRIIMVGSSALATLALTPALAAARAVRPNSLGNSVVTYQDGVGVVNAQGQSVLRVYLSASGTTLVGAGQTVRGPVKIQPGQQFTLAPGTTVSVTQPSGLLVASYANPNGSGWVNATTKPASYNDVNHYNPAWYSSPQHITSIDDRKSGGGGPGPHPLDIPGCILATGLIAIAGVALVESFAQCFLAPWLEPWDITQLALAIGAFEQAAQYWNEQCTV